MTEKKEYIRVGDTVRLKSGGPVMTVGQLTPPRTEMAPEVATCTWFQGDAPTPFGAQFVVPVLTLARPPGV